MDQTVALNIRTGPRGRWPTSSATSAPANDARPAARCDGTTAGKGGFWDQLHERGWAPRPRGPESCNFAIRSEEHTSELQSLMRISYAVFCSKKKRNNSHQLIHTVTCC